MIETKKIYNNDLIQKQIEINGTTYTLQRIPFKFYLELNDKHTGKNGVLQQSGFGEDLLKHCVISPKVSLKDFEYDYHAGMELIREVETFLTTKPNQTPDTKES